MEKHEKVYQNLRDCGYNGWGGENYETRMKGWENQLDKLFDSIELQSGKILELGCGAGDVSIKLAQRGFEVTGIDISPTAIEWAKEKSKELGLEIQFIEGSVCDNSILEGKKYDLIIDGNCLHCLFGEDRNKFYSNLKRLIKAEGSVFISTAIRLHAEDPVPQISSIERCIVTKDELLLELKSNCFMLTKDWISNETHVHYYGVHKYV